MRRYLTIVVMVLIPLTSIAQQVKSTPFYNGYKGYSHYRIPAIIQAPDGSLLAFCEARKNGRADSGDIDLVMRRSSDLGKSWDEMSVVWDDSTNTCGNPVPVVEVNSGRIFLFTCWNRGDVKEDKTSSGKGFNSRRVFLLHSDDNGISWSNPKELTDYLKLADWTWYATGPCHGIQKTTGKDKGRLIIPANHRNSMGINFSHVIYSDDYGKSWILGATAPAGGNESTAVELKNGNLMLNMRNYNRDIDSCRTYVISKNGGESFSRIKHARQLIEPLCQGSILNYRKNGLISDTLLFSNPHNKKKRVNMSISISTDSGKKWQRHITVYKGKSAYSDMVQINDKSIGILYENGEKEQYERITFEIITLY